MLSREIDDLLVYMNLILPNSHLYDGAFLMNQHWGLPDISPRDFLYNRENISLIFGSDSPDIAFYVTNFRIMDFFEKKSYQQKEKLRLHSQFDPAYRLSQLEIFRDETFRETKRVCSVYQGKLDFYNQERVSNIETIDSFSYYFLILKKTRWYVNLSYEGYASISYITDPIGIKEIFKLRDIPEGKTRRTALRHWVSEHYRQLRSDPDVETEVREHLRGAREFRWSGLNCKIFVPPPEIKREDEAKEKRKRRRKLGLDRRLR